MPVEGGLQQTKVRAEHLKKAAFSQPAFRPEMIGVPPVEDCRSRRAVFRKMPCAAGGRLFHYCGSVRIWRTGFLAYSLINKGVLSGVRELVPV